MPPYLLNSVPVASCMIPTLLAIAAILWLLLLLFEKISSCLPVIRQTPPAPSTVAPVRTAMAVAAPGSRLGIRKTRIPTPAQPVEPVSMVSPDRQQPADDERRVAGANQPVDAAGWATADQERPPSGDYDTVLPGDDQHGEGSRPVVSTMAAQLAPLTETAYEALEMETDALLHFPLQTIGPAPVDPPALPIEQYARRLETVRSAAFDIARLVRHRQRQQSPEKLATQLAGLIQHYQLDADKNVSRIIEQAHQRSRQTYDEHIDLFYRIQNAVLAGELAIDPAASVIHEQDEETRH